MSNNSDPLFDRYASMDFSDAKPVTAVPALAQLQGRAGFCAYAEITSADFEPLERIPEAAQDD